MALLPDIRQRGRLLLETEVFRRVRSVPREPLLDTGLRRLIRNSLVARALLVHGETICIRSLKSFCLTDSGTSGSEWITVNFASLSNAERNEKMQCGDIHTQPPTVSSVRGLGG